MNKKLKKGVVVLTTSIFLLSGFPYASKAMDFTMTSFPSSTPFTTNLFNTMNQSNYAMESLQQQQEFFNTPTYQQPQKVSAVGYIVKKDDKFYLDTNGSYHEIITKKGDILAVLPLLVDTEILVEFIGEYNSKTKQIFAAQMNLLKKPSDELMEEIDNALKEYKKTQDISGRGYITEDDGKYKLSVNDKLYTILTAQSDIEVVLPIISNENIMVELIGQLDEEAMTFTAKKLNFLDKPSNEKIQQINQVLLENKDGKEVNATGRIKGSDGSYSVRINGEDYKLLISDEHPDIQRVVPVLSNKELLVNVIGVIDIDNKSIQVNKLDIVDRPSDSLQKQIAEALKGYEEGQADARGYIITKGDALYLKVEDKEYKISTEKEDLETFINVVKDKDVLVQISGYLSNKNKTVKAEKALLIDKVSDELKNEIATAMNPYIKLPENGSVVDAQGKIIKKGDDYFIEVAFSDYKVTSDKNDLMQSLSVLANTEIPVLLTGKIDTENKSIKGERLTILEKPNDTIKQQLDQIIAQANKQNGNTNNTNQNNPFANFSGFQNLTQFPSFQGFPSFSNQNGNTQNNPFANFKFDFSKFPSFSNFSLNNSQGNQGNLFSNLGNLQMPQLPQLSNQNNLSNLFQNFFANKGANSSTFLFSNQQMANMPTLSFDQIQQVLNNMGKTSSLYNTSNTGGTSSGNGFSFGGGSGTNNYGFSFYSDDSSDE